MIYFFLLVTAGVYEPVKEGTPYGEITRLRKAGKSAKEIMEITGLSSAAVSAYIPYERGVYNADRSGAKISSAAERKRKQRGGEETRRMNARSVLQGNVTDGSFWKAIQKHDQEVFISTDGQRYSVNVQFTAPEKGIGAAGPQQDLQIRPVNGGALFFPREMVLDVLHNALDLMAEGEETAALSFDRTEALPYVYPLLVFFGIIPGDKAQCTTRRMLADPDVCSFCGRMADYTVRTYADLVKIEMEIEEEERGKWDPAERERVERTEAALGRVKWHEKAGRLARDYTGTDYAFRTGMRAEESDWSGSGGTSSERLRKTYIGFLELADHIRDALQNPTLDWHEGFPYLSNAVDLGGRQCTLNSIGEMQVVYVDAEPEAIGGQRGLDGRVGDRRSC